MAKTLIIIRHAKSDWSGLALTDFERTLNHRGLNDAPLMGTRLANRNFTIDGMLVSASMRTRQTAELLNTALKISEQNIVYTEALYHASSSKINLCIQDIPETWQCALVICHNNGITDWVNNQSNFKIDNMPTCSMAGFKADVATWHSFIEAEKEFLFFDAPKL